MVDIHCHILPAVDDGASTWKTAIEMCRMAAKDGIDHIVGTPHANYRYAYDRNYCEDLVAELRGKITAPLELHLGCDFHLSYENFLAVLKEPSQFTIGNTSYLLVELDDFSVPASISDNLQKLIAEGLTPIITHPERNQLLQSDLAQVQKWVTQGCLVQVTASSLTGQWGRKARTAVEWLLQRQCVHAIATDAHNTTLRRPVLSQARVIAESIVGNEASWTLVNENPLAIINGKPILSSSSVSPNVERDGFPESGKQKP